MDWATAFNVKVYGRNLSEVVHLQETDEGLEVVCDTGDDELSVVLDAYHVSELRKALQRFERRARGKDND